MAEQACTIMVIKVDLQCGRCYKKIQKILCEIPQVKDRIFNEKQNTVTITVVCCCPEKIRQKICRKGEEIILGIDIIPPKQEKEVQKPKPSTKDTSTQTQEPDTKDQEGQPPLPFPPPPVLGYPLAYAMGALGRPYVCPPWPICHNGCRRPAPMCHDGCGRPAHEGGCRKPSYLRCCDLCNDGSASSSWMLHSCDH